MACSRLTGSILAVLLTCGLAAAAQASPLAGKGMAAAAMAQPVAHKHNEWYWSGHWWRPGPWSDHVIRGMVHRRGHGAIFLPWGAERLRYCAAKYRSFDPTTGTYVTRSGERRVCR